MKLSSICSTAILSIATALMGACSADATAQMTFSVEEYMVHDADTGIPELEGMTTYRIYVNLEHELDFVSALYGGSESPFVINVDDPMFNSPFATGATSGGVIAMLTSYFPEVGFDSWLTIGLESAPEHSPTQWSTNYQNQPQGSMRLTWQ